MIVGGGKSSYYLAKQLIRQKMDVRIIEKSRERCEELSALLPQAVVICGDGVDEALLNTSMHCAKDYRTRYTLFKLLDECGLLEDYLKDYPNDYQY